MVDAIKSHLRQRENKLIVQPEECWLKLDAEEMEMLLEGNIECTNGETPIILGGISREVLSLCPKQDILMPYESIRRGETTVKERQKFWKQFEPSLQQLDVDLFLADPEVLTYELIEGTPTSYERMQSWSITITVSFKNEEGSLVEEAINVDLGNLFTEDTLNEIWEKAEKTSLSQTTVASASS